MLRVLGYVVFALVVVSVIVSAHYYLWARLVRDPGWSPLVRRVSTLVIVFLAMGIPASMILARQGYGTMRPLVWGLYVWMGLCFLLVTVLGVTDLACVTARLVQRVAGQTSVVPTSVERRMFLSRVVGLGALAGAVVVGAGGMVSALGLPAVRRVRVGLSRLPAALSGISIVQICDLHLGSLLSRDWLAKVVQQVNLLAPDVVVITGDVVDSPVSALRDVVAPLAQLQSRWGVYFVTGNHEYYVGVDEWINELGRLGVRVLRNERVSIGGIEASFDLAGIDDTGAVNFGHGHGADLNRALRGYDPTRELVLLAHQPNAVEEASRRGVGLQLSGHTHGGQIWPFSYLVRLSQPQLAGLSRYGNTQLYVSRGTGFWGPPMRICAPSEITHIELVRA